MRKGFLGAFGALLTGAGLAAASAPSFQPAVSVPYPAALGGPGAPAQMAPGYGMPYGYPQGAMPQAGWGQQPPVRVFNGLAQPPAPGGQGTAPTLPPPEAGSPPAGARQALPPPAPPEVHSVPTPLGPSASLPYPDIAESVFADGGRPAILPDESDCDYKRWLSAEYLLWIIRRGSLPSNFVTGGPPANRELFGGSLDYGAQHGFRAHGGKWFCTDFGFELGGFMILENTVKFPFNSDANGNPQITRPFRNADTGLVEIGLGTSPGLFSGTLSIESTTQLWGCEADFLWNIGRGQYGAVNLIGGLRYLHLMEGLDITQTATPLSAGGTAFFNGQRIATGQSLLLRDAFDSNNDFFGGHFGAQFGAQCGKLFVGFNAKVSAGVNYETVDIRGNTTFLPGNGTFQTVPGGVIAVGSNTMRHTSGIFAVVPEAGMEVAYQISPKWTLSLGYSFLYWTRVVRATEQATTLVSGSQIPVNQTFTGPNPAGQPRPTFDDGCFWAQGLSAGLAFRY